MKSMGYIPRGEGGTKILIGLFSCLCFTPNFLFPLNSACFAPQTTLIKIPSTSNWGSRMHGWAVAITQPQQEAKAKRNAERQGFQVWYPCLKTVKRFAGRRWEDIQPLFPRYIFVRVQDAWRSLSSTVGVSSVIMGQHNGQPAPVLLSETIMSDIRSRCDAQGFYNVSVPAKFHAGQKVKVTAGPFYGFTGVFHELRGEDRALVLLKMLGSEVKTNVAEGDLTAA